MIHADNHTALQVPATESEQVEAHRVVNGYFRSNIDVHYNFNSVSIMEEQGGMIRCTQKYRGPCDVTYE